MIDNKEKTFISAVVYVYNDDKRIGSFLETLNGVLSDKFEKYEIICVNDSSVDESVSKIKEFAQKTQNTVISIVNMSYYQGLEMCMNAGVDLSIGDFVYEFDSVNVDYEPELIMNVYNKSLEGKDIVSAISTIKKRKSSGIFYKIFNSYSKNANKLNSETFRILSRRAINRIQSMNKTIPYRKAVYANCGLKIDSIVYKSITAIKCNDSKQTKDTRKDVAIDALILFTDIAYKASIFMTIFFLCAMIAVAVYTVIIFVNKTPVEGWTTTMLFMSLAFFGVFMFFAIIIKYLSILINLIFKKQKYTIESIEKISK